MKILLSLLILYFGIPAQASPCSLVHEYQLTPNLRTVAIIAKISGFEKSQDLKDEIDTKEISLRIVKRIQYPTSLPDTVFARLYGHSADCRREYASSKDIPKSYPVGTEFLILGQIDHSRREHGKILDVDESFIARNEFEGKPIYLSGSVANFTKIANDMERCRVERIADCHNVWVAYEIALAKMLQELSRSADIPVKKTIILAILQPGLFQPLEVEAAIELYFADESIKKEIRGIYKSRSDALKMKQKNRLSKKKL